MGSSIAPPFLGSWKVIYIHSVVVVFDIFDRSFFSILVVLIVRSISISTLGSPGNVNGYFLRSPFSARPFLFAYSALFLSLCSIRMLCTLTLTLTL